jgi:predicted flap endonuclease-1-like 5' DNA nuclease
MPHAEMKNAPPLYGWAIAAAAGAVAAAVSYLIVGIEGNGSVAVGAVIALVVGVIFTIAETPPKTKAPIAGHAKTAAAPVASAAPSPAPSPAPAAPEMGTQPTALAAPQGAADDLKQISGVGPVLERKLNDLGIYHFWQIAKWGEAEIAWVDESLNFKGRITRDGWIAQASKLAEASPATPQA